MNLTIEQREPLAVVALHSESLEARNTKEFRRQMEPILEEFDVILLDMGELTFVDSAGLGALLACLRRLKKLDGLYDAVLKVAVLGARDAGLISTLTLSGATYGSIERLTTQYVNLVSWR